MRNSRIVFSVALSILTLGMGSFSVFTTAQAVEVNPFTAKIIMTKIVCPNEANLPNLGFGGADMTDQTVNDFLTLHPNCYRQSGWNFQYDTSNAPNPGDNLIGEAGAPWGTTAPTDVNGETSFDMVIDGPFDVHIREVMQTGYIGFTHGDAPDNSLGYTAELYCGNDVANYDNFDFISNPVAGETYRCVAWNVPVRTYAPFCGDNVVNQSWESCDAGVNGSETCTAQCQAVTNMCTPDVFARVVVTNTENTGYGDVTDVVYVGGMSQPDFAWFPVKLGANTIVDPSISTYHDNAGIAVERSLDGIRVRLYGSHNDGSREHSEGYVEFSNGTSLATQVSDVGDNAVENATDGIKEVSPAQDEIWIDAGKSNYWFTVSGKNDGFVSTYIAPVCEGGNTDLCSNIEEVQLTVPEGMTANDGICLASGGNGGEGNGGNGDGSNGGGGSGGGTPPACADGSDNDNDGLADYPKDPGCSSSIDNDETDVTVSSASTGNGTGSSTGEVLGATTDEPALPPQCSAYLTTYMKMGKKNNVEDVKNLQSFLNEIMGTNIPVTGLFGNMTKNLVKKFQVKYHKEIIQPWVDAGWGGKDIENGSGYVFKTTKRQINLMKCSVLNDPLGDLKPDGVK